MANKYKERIVNFLGKQKLNRKFLLMYVFCVLLPLILTDTFLFRSVFEAEFSSQAHYRDNAIEAYTNYLDNLTSYDEKVSEAIDINKNLNTFINTPYDAPYDYYDELMTSFSNSFFSTLADLNQDRIVIYSNNPTMLNGNYFHNLSEAQGEKWYKDFIRSGVDEAFYAYYDYEPVSRSNDRNRFVYVRRLKNTKSDIEKIVTIEHKKSRIASEMQEIPVNCTMYLYCDNYLVYSTESGMDFETMSSKASHNPYATVKDIDIKGTSFRIYAFTEGLTITNVITNNLPIILVILLFTLIMPIVLLKLLERSITDRVQILGKAFGEGNDEYFQPIKEINGTDEISDLMHNYNRIVGINNELTNMIYKDKLREQESDLARKNAELLALQSQINPHFLFNALESIRMHSVLKGEKETAEMVQKLAVMERQNVEWHDDMVTIEEEEEFIDAYLQLQSYRFGDRISFEIDIDDDCKKIRIPKLTLVTFVENACVHGIESKSAQGWIFVRVNKKEDQLIIEVEDTGDGMEESDVDTLQQKMNGVTIDMVKEAKHVGILNACLRIKMMFNNRAKFAIESEKGIGMSVIITIPADLITTAE
ncbi:MAG: histidine kinase [Clostridiales bacterium]|nr:histidine kinase [Clostridiales bacterium]MBR4948184.1 histidine kinase [Clostridiales bacterium]